MSATSTITFNADWPLPNDYLLELGRIFTLWGSLESLLNVCVLTLAGYSHRYDARGLTLVIHSSFQQRLDSLESLCDLHVEQEAHLKEFKTTISLIKKAQTSRNRFAHNGMNLNLETKNVEMGIATSRGKLKTVVNQVTLDDVKSVSVEIQTAMRSLLSLVFPNVELGTPSWQVSK